MPKRADRRHLVEVSYVTDAGLNARASLYEDQRPHINLVAEALDLLGEVDGRRVLDVGCGNGRYLAGLTAAGARVVGIDLSAGMLATVPAPRPPLVVGDAVALPVADQSADAVLLPHMLYHVPEPGHALDEAHRALRPGAQVLVVINGPHHLQEMNALWLPLLEGAGVRGEMEDVGLVNPRVQTSDARALVDERFTGLVERHLPSEVILTDAGPAVRHAASTTAAFVAGPELVERFRAAVTERIEDEGALTITTDVTMLLAFRPD